MLQDYQPPQLPSTSFPRSTGLSPADLLTVAKVLLILTRVVLMLLGGVVGGALVVHAALNLPPKAVLDWVGDHLPWQPIQTRVYFPK